MLFETTVRAVRRLSPGFVRITLGGPRLGVFAPYQLDQRIKILLAATDGYPAMFQAGMPEWEWRQQWRALPERDRPVLRSYTAYQVRPEAAEVDLDFYIHQPPGPASNWAANARVGDPLLISGPDVRAGQPAYGVQWEPGDATHVLIAADETAYPAVRGILPSLGPKVRATLILEAGTREDIGTLDDVLAGHRVEVRLRGNARDDNARGGNASADNAGAGNTRGGDALVAGVDEWLAAFGSRAAANAGAFYAWAATESTRVARIRQLFASAGIPAARVHTQGYWHDRPRLA